MEVGTKFRVALSWHWFLQWRVGGRHLQGPVQQIREEFVLCIREGVGRMEGIG